MFRLDFFKNENFQVIPKEAILAFCQYNLEQFSHFLKKFLSQFGRAKYFSLLLYLFCIENSPELLLPMMLTFVKSTDMNIKCICTAVISVFIIQLLFKMTYKCYIIEFLLQICGRSLYRQN